MLNEEIKAVKVKLVVDGESPKLMDTSEALELASEQELDLVVVNDRGDYPFVKIMDYSKYLYEQKKKQKKNIQKNRVEVKEIRLSPTIAENDLKVKAKTADRILTDGDKLIVTIKYPGRMVKIINQGAARLEEFSSLISTKFKVEKPARINGYSVSMTLVPLK